MAHLWTNVLAGFLGAVGVAVGILMWRKAGRTASKLGRLQSRFYGERIAGRVMTSSNVRVAALGWMVIGLAMVTLACFGLFA